MIKSLNLISTFCAAPTFIGLLSLRHDMLSPFAFSRPTYMLYVRRRECDKGEFHVGLEQHGTEYNFLLFSLSLWHKIRIMFLLLSKKNERAE